MRGSEKSSSILAANGSKPSEQGADVRPSLDALVAAVCAELRSKGRRLRALPIKGGAR